MTDTTARAVGTAPRAPPARALGPSHRPPPRPRARLPRLRHRRGAGPRPRRGVRRRLRAGEAATTYAVREGTVDGKPWFSVRFQDEEFLRTRRPSTALGARSPGRGAPALVQSTVHFPDHGRRHFETLAHFARQSARYRLTVGDLGFACDLVISMLDRLHKEARSGRRRGRAGSGPATDRPVRPAGMGAAVRRRRPCPVTGRCAGDGHGPGPQPRRGRRRAWVARHRRATARGSGRQRHRPTCLTPTRPPSWRH